MWQQVCVRLGELQTARATSNAAVLDINKLHLQIAEIAAKGPSREFDRLEKATRGRSGGVSLG